jgi:hypothetical protein
MQRVLVGEPFWGLWGGRVFHTVIMAAVVAWTLQLFESGMREFVDTNVQSTLLRRMSEADYAPPACAGSSRQALAGCIAIIGIDDADFRGVFQQQSPLNPDVLGKLLDGLRQSPPRVVAIDLDLSPASAEDWPARERLLARLQALARVTRLVMVCPQGYSTPEPGPLDKAWVQRFDSRVQFASADLNVDGLYYDKEQALPTLGVATADAASQSLGGPAASVASTVDWHALCAATPQEVGHRPELALIRPAAVATRSFSQALGQSAQLADRVVLIGGQWGINDQFKLRGQSDAFFGVNLHAWVTATELSPAHEPAEAAVLIMELVIGMVAGAGFTLVWAGITGNRQHFAKRSFFYLLFFALAFGLPLVWVTAAAHLAKFGLVLGAAGMVLSAAADSFLSSHEAVLEAEPEERHKKKEESGGYGAPLLALLLAAVLFAAALQWGQSFWVCLACGGLAGLVLGVLDRRAKAPAQHGQAETSPHAHGQPRESNWDLLARLAWTALKGMALLWLLRKDHHATTTALVLGFLLCWCGAYGWAALRHRPAARAGLRA